MLRDITIGQYFPGHSFIHKMDPRMKLIAAVLYIPLKKYFAGQDIRK
mgnify:CR=1 FL=1